MKTTTYIFRKLGNGYAYVKDNALTRISANMMACLLAQYKMMGYTTYEGENIIAVCLVDTTEDFMKKILKKG